MLWSVEGSDAAVAHQGVLESWSNLLSDQIFAESIVEEVVFLRVDQSLYMFIFFNLMEMFKMGIFSMFYMRTFFAVRCFSYSSLCV